MTVSSELSQVSYDTDGVTTAFPVPFYFLANDHLRVWLFYEATGAEIDLVLGANFLVSGAGVSAGGTVTTLIAYPAGPKLRIERVVPITQETAYQRNDPFPERAHERALDKLTMICQQLAGLFGLVPGSTLRALLLGRNDVDGQGAYRARGNRIQDLGAPVEMNDAARRQDIVEALADLSTDGTGQFVVERLADSGNPTNGANMVGYQLGGAGTVPRTVAARLRDFQTFADYQIDRTGATDTTSRLQAYFDDTRSDRKYLPAGTYKVNAPLTMRPGTLLEGDGPSTIIDASAGTFPGGAVISVTGSLTALPNLSADAAVGGTQLTFASAPAVSKFDPLVIYNPTNSSFSAWRTYYRAGEFVRAGELSGNTLQTLAVLWGAYTAAAVSVYKLTGKSTSVRNLAISTPAGMVAGLKMSLIDRPIVEEVHGSGLSEYAAVYLDRCVDIRVVGRAMQSSALTGYQYGVVIANCQGGTIEGEFYGRRHAIGLGSNDLVGGVPTRGLRINASMGNNAPNGACDTHGNTEGITFVGGRMSNGGVLGGRSHTFVGVKLVGNLNLGCALYAGELVGGAFSFIGCDFSSVTNPTPNSRGMLDFTLQASTQNSCEFNFTGCNFAAPAGCAYIAKFSVGGANVPFRASFDNCHVLAAQNVTQFALLERTSGTGFFDSFQISNITGLPAGGVCFYATTDGVIPVLAWRLPTQEGSISAAYTSGTNQASTSKALAYKYPKTPYFSFTAVDTAVGGQKVLTARGAGADGATASVNLSSTSGGGNFTSSGTLVVHYRASIQE